MSFHYPQNLPISEKRQEIQELLKTQQVIIVSGDTGSGKTTQLPKMCLEIRNDGEGRIGCTQPRRIAALTVSSRVAEELGEMGHLVGHKIRFHEKLSRESVIKFMTDGILLAEIRKDRLLRQYSYLIIDEAHERSLNIDFLLGHIHRILPERVDLKVIITSATIDTEAFSRHFNDAPVVAVAGKTYPIETRYVVPALDDYGEPENYIDASVHAVRDLLAHAPPGDILLFLPTEKDILNCRKELQKKCKGVMLLPLFGRLHPTDQKKIFQQFPVTKVVIATNVAETSITVPGIRYVVDTGLARISHYNIRSKTNSLPIRKISQASCDQRRGRCGRVGPGVCIRLFDEADYMQREEFSVPEIQRSNLAEVILQMLSSKLGDPATFPFLDPPQSSAIHDGYRQLIELGALDKNRKITRIGRIMSSLPIDPCISRIIIEASGNECLREIMVIATVLAIQDPRARPVGYEKEAEKAQEKFGHEMSDFLVFLNIWNLFHHVKAKTSWSKLKKFCAAYFLSFQRMREWMDLHDQMVKIVRSHEQFSINSEDASYDAIHKSLAVGFLRNIGMKKEGKIYQGPANREVMLFPGSHLFESPPQWILAASFLETNRLYALTAAAIQPDWLERIGGDLCAFSWSDARYMKKSGQIMANEKVSLFGLPIVPSRRVNFGKTSPGNRIEARKIFIQSALIEQQLGASFPFYSANLNLLQSWRKVEDRVRTKDIVCSDGALYDFYDSRIPDWVYDRPTLQKFLKNRANNGTLTLTENDIVQRYPQDNELSAFPTELRIDSYTFSVSYVFSPGTENDGMTVSVPHELFAHIPPTVFEWIAPGFLEEKVTFLLKSLPKKLRKQLVPVTTAVDRVLDDMPLYRGSFFGAVEDSLFKLYRLVVRNSDWPETIPDHLRMRISLKDFAGTEIDAGRDAEQLRKRMRTLPAADAEVRKSEKELINHWKSLQVNEWCFDGLPRKIPLYDASGKITGFLYPALETHNGSSSLGIDFHTDLSTAQQKSRAGLRSLYSRSFSHQFKSLKHQCTTSLSGPSSLWMVNIFPSKSDAVRSILDFIVRTLFSAEYEMIFDKDLFTDRFLSLQRDAIYSSGAELLEKIMSVLRMRKETVSEIERYGNLEKNSRTYSPAKYQEYIDLLNAILPDTFCDIFSADDLGDALRYMKCLQIRIKRAHADPAKDRKKADELAPFLSPLKEMETTKKVLSGECRDHLRTYAEMIQEFRISLFAPEIKTKYPVSAKKLRMKIAEIRKTC